MARFSTIGSIGLLLIVALSSFAGCARDRQASRTEADFQRHCATCHGNPDRSAEATDEIQLRKMTPEAIYAALSRAPHVPEQGPTDEERRRIAGYLGGRKVDVAKIADAK